MKNIMLLLFAATLFSAVSMADTCTFFKTGFTSEADCTNRCDIGSYDSIYCYEEEPEKWACDRCMASAVDNKPTLTVTASPASTAAGSNIAITVVVTDDKDVDRLQIIGGDISDTYDCAGTQISCDKTWSVTRAYAGSYTYYGYAYDSASQMATKSVDVEFTTPSTTTTTTTTTVPGDTCTEELVCSGSDLYYRNADCTASFQNTCAFGCSGGSCNGEPSSTTTTSTTTTTTVPANVCAAQSFPASHWQRNWYVYDGGQRACLGTGPDQSALSFDDDWGTGAIAHSKSDGITFTSTRMLNLEGGGLFSFLVGADDGIILYIGDATGNDRIVVNDWSDHSYREQRQDIELREGDHRLQIQYYENTGYARVKFELLPKPLETVDLRLIKTEFDQGEAIYLYAIARGDEDMGTFYEDQYRIKFSIDGTVEDCSSGCVVPSPDTCAFTNTDSPELCWRSLAGLAPGEHTIRAEVYQGSAPLEGVYDEEKIKVRNTPPPPTTTTTTTVLVSHICDFDSQCPISEQEYDSTGTKRIYCDSPTGTRNPATAVPSYDCYAPAQCLGKQINPATGKAYGNELCAPAYCCTGALPMSVVSGDGYCVLMSTLRGANNWLCGP